VIGICGGFQMLGRSVADPHGVEGAAGVSEGLGLLEIDTELAREKRLALVTGRACMAGSAPFELRGYEIHMGVSAGAGMERPAFVIDGRNEGACSEDDQVLGTYLHGVFDHPDAGAALLAWAGLRSSQVVDTSALREASIDRIADATAPVLDRLLSVMGARAQ
jgi:adenosylcobyric acid synthase